ncbi:hypothetical protein Dimus_018578, partial [Dionaea muscipula]
LQKLPRLLLLKPNLLHSSELHHHHIKDECQQPFWDTLESQNASFDISSSGPVRGGPRAPEKYRRV